MKEKILVAMSGGVDSGVSAYLLKEQGFDVIGAFMKLHELENTKQEAKCARLICESLGIEFHEVDLQKEFNKNVIDYFCSSYIEGKTPNPCVVCNKKMKFGALLKVAQKLGANKFATGHYAHIEQKDGNYILKKADDDNKDQTYVLVYLDQNMLSHTVFPLANYKKWEIKKISEDLNLPCTNKPESQDICFIKDQNYSNFITQHSNYRPKAGNIKDERGNVVGKHKGLINYTIGQRRGIDVAFGSPMYVKEFDVKNNELIMAPKEHLLQKTVMVKNININPAYECRESFKAEAKTRYRQKQKPCYVEIDKTSNKLTLTFDDPILAVTPGQFAVIYDGNYVVGGGEIYNI